MLRRSAELEEVAAAAEAVSEGAKALAEGELAVEAALARRVEQVE